MEIDHPVSSRHPSPFKSSRPLQRPEIDQGAQRAVTEPSDSNAQPTTQHQISGDSHTCSVSSINAVQVSPSSPVIKSAHSQRRSVPSHEFTDQPTATLAEYFHLTGSYLPSSSHCLSLPPGIGYQRSSFDESDPSEVPAVGASDVPFSMNLVDMFPTNLLSASVLDDTRVPYSHYRPYNVAQAFPERVRCQFRVAREGTPLDLTAMGTTTPLAIPLVEESAHTEQCPRIPMSGSSTSPSSELSIASSSVPEALSCHAKGCSVIFQGQYRKGNLARHIRLQHRGGNGAYPCEDTHCSRSFKRSDARLKHYRKHHPYLAPRSLEHRLHRVPYLSTERAWEKE